MWSQQVRLKEMHEYVVCCVRYNKEKKKSFVLQMYDFRAYNEAASSLFIHCGVFFSRLIL